MRSLIFKKNCVKYRHTLPTFYRPHLRTLFSCMYTYTDIYIYIDLHIFSRNRITNFPRARSFVRRRKKWREKRASAVELSSPSTSLVGREYSCARTSSRLLRHRCASERAKILEIHSRSRERDRGFERRNARKGPEERVRKMVYMRQSAPE